MSTVMEVLIAHFRENAFLSDGDSLIITLLEPLSSRFGDKLLEI